MKKAKLLAPRNMAREVLSDTDAQRMLDSGSWVLATIPKKRSARAINQQNYMRRRREAGYRKLEILLPEYAHDILHSMQRDGETMAELVERLILLSSDDNSEKG